MGNYETLNLTREDVFLAIEKAKKIGSQKIISEVKDSSLRGMGGAGFPTGMKWEATFLVSSSKKYVVANGHEGEPFTLKDKFLLANFPHLILGGMLIAAISIGSDDLYIVINGSYKEEIRAFKNEIKIFEKRGLLKNKKVIVSSAANYYIGGEESALLNELEGKRIEPRKKPPFVSTAGLFGGPTIVDNVETLANIPFIIGSGAKGYKRTGIKDAPGRKLLTVSGDVKAPGVYEVDMGTNLKTIIELAGGAKGRVKFILTGGYSGTIVLPKSFSSPVSFDSFVSGIALGAGTVIVYNEKTNLIKTLKDLAAFYKVESCGQCTPCREGTTRLYEILISLRGKISKQDKQKIDELINAMDESSLCAFGPCVGMAIKGIFKFFGKEIVSAK